MNMLFVLLPFLTLATAKPLLEALLDALLSEKAEIVHADSDVSPDGTYHYSYEVSDGTKASQEGYLKHVDEKNAGEAVVGQYEYHGDDGKVYSVSYYADETGFHPEGDHIPKTPEAIARALEWAAEHPYKE